MEKPVRSLNKKHIYLCMFGLFVLSIPAIISLASHDKKITNSKNIERTPQVNLYAHDTKAITGTEHFPETYSDVKSFEKKQQDLKPKKAEEIVELLATHETQPKPQHHAASYGYRHDDPWADAKKQEQKRRAQDYYEARHSEIMFINNVKQQPQHKDEREEVLDFMDRALAMAENSPSPSDILMIRNNEEKNSYQAFLGNKSGSAGQLKNPSKYMLSRGTLINATLLSEISTDLPGPILARVSYNIWDSKTGKTLLIPQDSKLIGEYNSTVGDGQSRAQIVWTEVIYPNQQSVDLGRMVGTDKKGISGSAGIVDNHYDKVALALLMTTTLGAGVRMTQGKYDPNSASIGQEIGNSLAQETARLSHKVADKMLSIKPTITVPMGERLNVFVEQDLHLEPYSG